MSAKYVVIKRAFVRKANANPAWYISGNYSLTAIGGFVQNVERIASELSGEPVKTDGFAVIHHDIDKKGERTGAGYGFQQHKTASFINKDDYSTKANGRPVLSAQPVAYADLTLSIVIKCQENIGNIKNAINQLNETGRLKIAGGQVDSFEMKDYESEEQAIRYIKNGFSLEDKTQLIQEYIDSPKPHIVKSNVNENLRNKELEGEIYHGGDVLDAALYYIHHSRSKEYPWTSLTLVGYKILTDIKERIGSRDSIKHAFCEPLVGLVSFTPMRKVGLVFWSPKMLDDTTFVFSV